MLRNMLIAIFCLGLLAGPVSAGFTGPGAQAKPVTVAAVKDLPDDTDVVLEGNVIRQLRREHYLFRDATGEIEVEIDDKESQGIDFTPATRLRLTGEVDRERDSVSVDVEHLEIVK